MSREALSEACGMTDMSDGGGLGEKEERDSGIGAGSLWEPLPPPLLLVCNGSGARWPSGTSWSWTERGNQLVTCATYLSVNSVHRVEVGVTLCCVCVGWQISMASSSWFSPSTLQRRRGTSVDKGARGMGIGWVWKHNKKFRGAIGAFCCFKIRAGWLWRSLETQFANQNDLLEEKNAAHLKKKKKKASNHGAKCCHNETLLIFLSPHFGCKSKWSLSSGSTEQLCWKGELWFYYQKQKL